MAVRNLKLLGVGAVRGSEGHPADDDLASEKGHVLAKRALFSTITRGGAAAAPCPPLGTALIVNQDIGRKGLLAITGYTGKTCSEQLISCGQRLISWRPATGASRSLVELVSGPYSVSHQVAARHTPNIPARRCGRRATNL